MAGEYDRPPLAIWVPTNRVDRHYKRTHMDGWNEIKSAFESGRNAGSALMRENVRHVARWTRLAMREQGWPEMHDSNAVPCKVALVFVELNRRRDVGNIHGGAKYALDGLTERHRYGAGAILDDSQRWLPEVEYHIVYASEWSRHEPGLEIVVTPLGT